MPPLLESWGVPRAKIVVLPSLYVDLEVFRPPAREAEPEHDVLFVGRMVANKGLDRIVDALAALAASRGRAPRALFVGKGPLAGALRDRVARRGLAATTRFVEWLATPEELAAVYRASRVCVCASTCEGGPRFTVEAMACGTPVVSTPVGVMGELLADGSCGLLAGFDAPSLARAVGALLDDEPRRRELGARAHEVAQRFEYARTIRGYAEGLYRLAGRPAPARAAEAAAR
jgi:glycosyltransferase involved in cell wall biosynthesis